MARGDQLYRQWTILDRLAQGRCSRRELAEALEVSLKTIARDIGALSLFPIVEEREGIDVFYRLAPGARPPSVRFSAEELGALLLAQTSILSALADSPHAQAVRSAFAKLELLQRDSGFRGRRGLPEVFQSSFETPAGPPEHRDALIEAALARRCVRLRYFTAERDAESERVVDPYHLHLHPHGLHLIAFCHQRREFLYFSVARIRELSTLELGFDPAARPLELDAFLATVFDGRRGLPLLEVTLRVREPSAHWARERFFHRSQEIREVEGGIEIRFCSGAPEAIAARVLGLGPDCEVLAPPSLRRAVAEQAARICQQYAKNDDLSDPGPDLSGVPPTSSAS